MPVRAVIFDFGGVITTSPFEAFARYEADNGLPDGFIRRLNATNPDDNAWARLERNEVDLDGFVELFEAEAEAAGHRVDGRAVLSLLSGELRPSMVEALRRCRARLRTAIVTNNFLVGDAAADGAPRGGPMAEVLDHVDVLVESSRVGLRKPDPAIYRLVCDELGVEPVEAVFLDDLGVNLKPARAMGMTTIKVVDPEEALAELERVVGFPLRAGVGPAPAAPGA
ncbi:MAG TPA: HAD-IA family hydrolase [Acidimicrobiales bacterium]|nr:HAD-IA family hydrolase [Acidimicrobiales bacterium]